MSIRIFTAFSVITLAFFSPPLRANDRDASSLGAEVRRVFATKCAICHGSDLAKPRGRFGYVLDLARVAGNREMVVPFAPAESELWELVRRGEMPPDDSPGGQLSETQKETVRAWIAAGAPSASLDVPAPPPPSEPETKPIAVPPSRRWLRWIGRFHLLVLHFPITLLLAAAGAEGLSLVRPGAWLQSAVRFCLLLAFPAAAVTAGLGWIHASGGNGAGMPSVLTIHRWLGTATALCAAAAAVRAERDAQQQTRSWSTRLFLATAAGLVGITAHFGGVLAHGPGFFDF